MSDVSRTASRPEYAELSKALVANLEARGALARDRIVVAVAGESGSGKSVTAASLARALMSAGHHAFVLHQDDYFHLPPRANHAAREADVAHVGPGEVNLQLLQSHVTAFRAGHVGVSKPTVNYGADRFDVERVDFTGVRVLVIEGTYALRLADIDVRIFLEATYADTRDRRRVRARDVDSPFVERVLAIEHDIIAHQRALADVIIDVHFAVSGPHRIHV